MKRYLRIYFYLGRYCLMGDLEFRFNFFLWCVSNTIWAFLLFLTVSLIYNQVDSIAGWGRNDAYVLAVVNSLIISFLWAFVLPSMVNFHNLTRKGEMDFILLKPLPTRFLVSCRTIEFDMYPRILVLIGVLTSFVGMHYQIPILNWLLFSISVILGVVIYYNFAFIITTTNFWLINLFNLENLFDAVYDMGRLPVGIFKGGLKVTFIYLIPMAFLGSYSTSILIGQGSGEILIGYIVTLILSSFLSQKFWNFAIKRYASASS